MSGTLVNGFEIKQPFSITQMVDPKTEAEVTLKTETVDVKIEVPANIGIVKVIPKEMEVTLY